MSKLPPFTPVSKNEMREFWTKYPNTDVRRLLLEVEHSRRVMAEVHDNFESIFQAYREKVGGSTMAIHQMRTLLVEEWLMGRYEKKGR